MANLGDISKINLPNGNVVNIKDATARSNVVLLETMNGQKNLLYVPSSVTVTDDYAGTPIVFASDSDGYVTASPQSDSRYFQYTSSQYKIDLSAGDYVLYADIKTTVNSANFKAVLLNTSNASIVELPMRNKTGVTTTAFTIATTGSYGLLAKLLGGSSRFMILKKSIWDAGFTDYQPYALPNTKITPELIDLVDSGAKNLLPNRGTLSKDNVTYTWTNGNVVVSGTKTSGANYVDVLPLTKLSDLGLNDKFVISNKGTNSYLSIIFWSESQSYTSSIDVISGSNVITIPTGYTHLLARLGVLSVSTGTISETIQPMICTKAAWDVSQKYVPYRPTYEETVEQVAENENNILIEDITSTYTIKTGYTLSTYSKVYKQGKHVFGLLSIKKDTGTIPTSQTTIATATNKPAVSYVTGCFCGTSEWDISTTGYVFINPSTGAILARDTAEPTTNTTFNIQVDYVIS